MFPNDRSLCIFLSARQFCLLLIQFFPYHLFHELGYKVSFHLASKIQELTLAVQILLWPNHTEELVSCNYFTTNYLKFDREIEKDYFKIDSFVIYMCLEGEFSIVYNIDQSIKMKKGETVLIPASLQNIFLLPERESEILEIYIG